MSKILDKLKGGDLRSIGRVDEVLQNIFKKPSLFGDVFEGMLNDDTMVRMRSADVIEKVSKRHPDRLQPFKDRLIYEIAKVEQHEVRWHVAQMFSYLQINRIERDQIIKILIYYIDTDKSNIVKVFSMQTLANFAQDYEAIRPEVIKKIKSVMKKGSPAVINRGKKLIAKLGKK